MKPSLTFTALIAILGPAAATMLAGGPLQVASGTPILWDSSAAIVYQLDAGPLGAFSESQSRRYAAEAFQSWANVPTARLAFEQRLMSEDVRTAPRFIAIANDASHGSVVVFDNVGRIVQGLYGEGQEQHILGFASPRVTDGRISRFVALLNGALSSNEATVRSTMVHEFGHALGLDHAQINADFAGDRNTDNDRFLPTMFPTSSDDDSSLMELNPDDISAISALYPSESFAQTFGRIRGRLARADGRPVLGANVLAHALRGTAEDPLHRYSCVSDYLMTSDGGFEIVVPTGAYLLRAEPIEPAFSAGSGVGPYAENGSGLSFTDPIKSTVLGGARQVMAGQTTDVGTLTVR